MVDGPEGAEDGATGEAAPADDRGVAAPRRSAPCTAEAAGRGALRAEGRRVERMPLGLARRTFALAARLDRFPSA